MGLIQNIRNVFLGSDKEIQAPAKFKAVSSMSSVKAHQLEELLDDCNPYDKKDPRNLVELNEILIDNLPPLKRAVKVMIDMAGEVSIEAESDAQERALNEISEQIPVRLDANPEMVFMRGIDAMRNLITRQVLRTGMGFVSNYYGSELSTDFDGVVCYDSKRFGINEEFGTEYFTYSSRRTTGGNGYILKVDMDSDNFHPFGLEWNPSSIWGLSMVDGGAFFGEMIIRKAVARKNLSMRIGSPMGFHLISAKNTELFDDDAWEAYHERVTDMANAYKKGLQMTERGKRVEMFQSLPADATLQSSWYGAGMKHLDGYVEELDTEMRYLSMVTGIPLELLGFYTGGDGFSGEKFKTLYRMLRGSIKTNQQMQRPGIEDVLFRAGVAEGLPANWIMPGTYEVNFSEPDFMSEKELAEIDKVNAEAMAAHLNNIGRMFFDFTGGNDEPVEEYKRQFGLDWLSL